MPKTLDEVITFVKDGAAEVGGSFTAPDDDWSPVLFGEVNGEMVILGVSEFFRNDVSKDVLAQTVIPSMIEHLQASTVAMLTSTWMLKFESEEGKKWTKDNKFPRPSEHPDRYEALAIMAASKDKNVLVTCPIIRHEDRPPTLSEWEDYGDKEGLHLDGRFFEPINRAFGNETPDPDAEV